MTNERVPSDKFGKDADHPDIHEINDWFLYGPKNADIESLVRELTLSQGLRLAVVEAALLEALRDLKTPL